MARPDVGTFVRPVKSVTFLTTPDMRAWDELGSPDDGWIERRVSRNDIAEVARHDENPNWITLRWCDGSYAPGVRVCSVVPLGPLEQLAYAEAWQSATE